MEPNNGTVAGGFRILLSKETSNLWAWPERAFAEGVLGGKGWKLTVLQDSGAGLPATRFFATKAEATAVRRQFVHAVSSGTFDGEGDLQTALDRVTPRPIAGTTDGWASKS